ncbi:MAG: hypothetical protein ACK5BY_02810 [Limnohabitans sp.]|jgi:hypothetical protein|uniref:hypothetical protein n=2 Tax=Limnohabitans sp. TaxID=1907725 RepID=UPI003918A9E7
MFYFKSLTVGLCLASALVAMASTPEELMARAMRDGRASSELTGPLADSIKSLTRSKAATRASIELAGDAGAGCKFFKVTLVQPDVPSVAGPLVGDYMTVSRTRVCPDSGQGEPEILECRIGALSCMPQKAASSSKSQ